MLGETQLTFKIFQLTLFWCRSIEFCQYVHAQLTASPRWPNLEVMLLSRNVAVNFLETQQPQIFQKDYDFSEVVLKREPEPGKPLRYELLKGHPMVEREVYMWRDGILSLMKPRKKAVEK